MSSSEGKITVDDIRAEARRQEMQYRNDLRIRVVEHLATAGRFNMDDLKISTYRDSAVLVSNEEKKSACEEISRNLNALGFYAKCNENEGKIEVGGIQTILD